MDPFSPTYLFLIFLFITAFSIGGIIANNNMKKKNKKADFQILPFVEKLLGEINCQFQKETKKGWHEYSFQFQNGNFIIICKENDHILRIHYPHFLTTNLDNINFIREICNACNAHCFTHNVIYTTNGKENNLSMHIISSITIVEDNKKYAQQLRENLSHFFSIAQEFYLHYDKAKEQFKEIHTYDIEKETLKYEREFFMLKEAEISHNDTPIYNRTSHEQPLCIAEILRRIYCWNNPELIELKVVTYELKTIVNQETIANFNISEVLIATDSNNNINFIGTDATLILTFSRNKETPLQSPEQMIIALHNEGRTSNTLYQRATISYGKPVSHLRNPEMDKTYKNNNVSFIFAFDIKPNKEELSKAQEFIGNVESNGDWIDISTFTKEEQTIYSILNTDIQQNYTYATSLYRQKRFYEAITEFEYVYNFLSLKFHDLDRKGQEFFYEICFYMGSSYCELGLEKIAYYYLDAIFPLNNLTYMQEYVNCLVNGKDFRTLSVIENMSVLLQHQSKANDNEMPDNIKRFLSFLQRRKAHHFIDLGHYEKAKKIFQLLYLDPESQDYALNELAYLQRITEKENKQKQESEEGSDNE